MMKTAWRVAPVSVAGSSASRASDSSTALDAPAMLQSAQTISRIASASGVIPGPGLSMVPNGRSARLRQMKNRPTATSASTPIRWRRPSLPVGRSTLIARPFPRSDVFSP